MASQINPNDINGAYPVAGQDNNSQGFRDNFTNTATNFQYAADEITDLQSKAVLKAALNNTTLDNNMLGSLLYNAQLQQMSQTRVALGTLSGSVTIDYAAGSYQTVTTSGSISLAFTNFPAAGAAGTVAVVVTITDTAYTLTVPTAVSVNTVGVQGLDTDTNIISFAAAGTYTFVFTTSDGGSSITLNQNNALLQPFNNTNENLASTAAADLGVTTSYFVTSGTATLPDGVSGQIKVFTQTTLATMVVTVANSGWNGGSSGTITLTAAGNGCTLQFNNGNWYCIGNNGCTFA